MFRNIRVFLRELRLSGLFGRAHKRHMAGNYQGALELLDEIMNSEPPDFIANMVLSERGEIEYRQGNHRAAVQTLQEYMIRMSDSPEAQDPTSLLGKQVSRAQEFIEAASNKT